MNRNDDNDVKECDLFVSRIISVSYPNVIGGLAAETSFHIEEWHCIASRWDFTHPIQFQFMDGRPQTELCPLSFTVNKSKQFTNITLFCAGDQL